VPKISKSVHVCESYSKPKVGHFLRHGVESFRGCLCKMPLVLDDTAIFTALADSDSIWHAVFDEV